MGMGWHGVGFGADLGDAMKGKKREHVSLGRVLTLFQPYKWKVLLTFLCIVAGALLGIVPPYLTARIIDTAIGGKNLRSLVVLTILTLAAVLISGFIGVLQSYLNNIIGQRVMADMREQLYRHLMTLSLRYFGKTKLGDLLSRFNNDIGGIQNVVTSTFVNIVSSIITIAVTLVFMFWYNWELTIVTIIIIPAFAVPTRQVGRIRRKLSKATQEKLAEMGSELEETIGVSGILLVKNFARQAYETKRFTQTSQDLAQLQIKQNMIGRWFFMFISLFSSLGPALIYLVGGLEIIGLIHGNLSLGQIVAFIALQGRLYPPATSLLNVWVDVQGAAALFERIFEVFDEPCEIHDAPQTASIQAIRGKITFDDVSFSYTGAKQELRAINFTAEPGQLTALVGPSGAGKTTITMLIPRLYDAISGTVKIDDCDVKQLPLASLGEHIGMVTQETYLFHATIRQNIAYGKMDADEAEIIAAAKKANIHDFIMTLPNGYETIVGERGYKLSGGEKQRVAIARVILKNPAILILDEATSSLDSHSETMIQQALEPLMRSRTTVVIAHRLSTILAADTILVVKDGTIAEFGTHAELLHKGGMYARLYRDQFKAETERLAALGMYAPLFDEAVQEK